MNVTEIPESVLQRLADRKQCSQENSQAIVQKMNQMFPASLEQEVSKKLLQITTDNASLKSKLKRMQLLTSEIRQETSSLVPCKKGCSACCHIKVEMCQAEAEIIGDYVHQVPKKFPKGVHFPPESSLGHSDTPCPFLKNNECSIYEVRPIVCRNFVVTDVDNLLCGFENRALDLAQDPRFVPVQYIKALPMLEAYQKLAIDQPWADIRQFFPVV